MKMVKKILLLLFIAFLCSWLLLPQVVLAQNQDGDVSEVETKNIVVEEGEVINRDFFGAGDSITISGVINGDAYLAGGSLSVDGIINGDLLAGGGVITLLGEVSDDVRVGGGNILINGIIGKNLTVFGGSVTVTKEAEIKGSLLAFGGIIMVNGPVGRDAQVFAGQASFGSQINGDLKGAIENLTLSSGARVLGNLEYESPKEAEIAKGATVSGRIAYRPKEKKAFQPEDLVKKAPFKVMKKARPLLASAGLIFNFVLGLIFISLFPKRTKGVVNTLTSRPWASLGIGFLTPILFAILVILLAVSLIGIPLVLILVPLSLFLVYFSKIFTALFLGEKFLRRGYVVSLFAGLLVYYLLGLVAPGGLMAIISFTFTFLGLGAFVLDQKSLRQKQAKKQKAPKES